MIALIMALAAITTPRIIEHSDPISDVKSVYLVVGGEDNHLALGCDNVKARKTLSVIVHFESYIGDATPGILAGGANVDYRFPNQPPISERWYAHEREAYSQMDRNSPMRFIQGVKTAGSVFVRVTNGVLDPVQAQFSFGDITPLVDEMLTRCGWNPDGTDPSKSAKKTKH